MVRNVPVLLFKLEHIDYFIKHFSRGNIGVKKSIEKNMQKFSEVTENLSPEMFIL